ncbi:MAG: DHHA1 domain-containing protein, partial [Spirochaetia bacterium]|nr:DHHA1 domain-containing protein [Spirochaetia bacterium]
RLRFDFTHFAVPSGEDLSRVEKQINEWVQESIPVNVEIMTVDDAKKTGAMALFDEKYKGDVRVVSVGGVSKELCAGTHLRNTGEIGLFKIISSGSTAAGIRRIEALTGMAAYSHAAENDNFMQEMKELFKAVNLQDLSDRIKKTVKDERELEKKLQDMKKQGVLANVDGYLKNARDVDGMTVLTVKLIDTDKETVRELGDILRQKVKKAVIVIASVADGKVAFVSMVSDELTDRLDAAKIVKQVAAICRGGGGGKKNMAEAGGKDPSKVDEALAMVEKAVRG